MSDEAFNAVIEKIASSPTKLAMLGKQAAREDKIFDALVKVLDSGLKHDARRELRHMLMSSGIMAATSAGGMVLKDLISEAVMGNRDEKKKQMEEKGKLQAQSLFKNDQVQRLRPIQANVFQKVVNDDEMLQDADREMLQSTFSTMRRFAPNLAADPNAVRSFLRESATYGQGPNYASLKNLADAERAVAQAGGIG